MLRLFKHRIVIICGHFGTGKTNISVNLALKTAENNENVIIADLDTVNPYFRTADNAVQLREKGIQVLLPMYANTNVDIPSLPPSLPMMFSSEDKAVIDVGGDSEGAVVLHGFKDSFEESGYDMYYVFNAYRPENADTVSSCQSLKEIELSSGLRFAGIINNTNLGCETDCSIVAESIEKAKQFSIEAHIPLTMTTAFSKNALIDTVVIDDITKKLF